MEAEEILPGLREAHEEVERLRAGLQTLSEHWHLERSAAMFVRRLLLDRSAPPKALDSPPEVEW